MDYCDDIGKKLGVALSVKKGWVKNGGCGSKYSLSCASSLWDATTTYIDALNNINNHDTTKTVCGQGGKGDDEDDGSGVDLNAFIQALQIASKLADVDIEDTPIDQNPSNPPQDTT